MNLAFSRLSYRARFDSPPNMRMRRACCLLIAICLLISTIPFLKVDPGSVAQFSEHAQCSVSLLDDCVWNGFQDEAEEYEPFEFDEKDYVEQSFRLSLNEFAPTQLIERVQSGHINHISDPHLRPPQLSFLSA